MPGPAAISLVGDDDDYRYVVCQRNGKRNGSSTNSFCIRVIVKVADTVYVVGEQQIRDLEQTPDLCFQTRLEWGPGCQLPAACICGQIYQPG
jgi:hypothetical protein